MNTPTLKETLKREMPHWLQDDPAFRAFVLDLTRREYADRRETDDRFNTLLAELRQDRERADKRWEEQNAKWEGQNSKWEEQNAKWLANQAELKRLHEEIMAIAQKHDRSIGALGSR